MDKPQKRSSQDGTDELDLDIVEEGMGGDVAERYSRVLLPRKTIQLVASGPVKITELERKIIDTAEFQRLRGIKQLGAAYLVYPTAVHTRFDHSLGTLQMLAEMIVKIRQNDHSSDEQRLVTRRQEVLARLYALLHDITHVPFGHTLEDELGLLERHDRNYARIQRLLGPNSTIGKIIRNDTTLPDPESVYSDLMDLLTWDGKTEPKGFVKASTFVYDLVSNTVCADLLDYIRRDDYFCNLGVGIKYHFLDYLSLDVDPRNNLRRVFVRLWKGSRIPRRDLLTDLCGLLSARYKLAERVYFHHGKINASAILGRALQEHFGDASREEMEAIITAQTDDSVLNMLCGSSNALARSLGEHIRRRELYSHLGSYTLEDLGGRQSRDFSISLEGNIERTVTDAKARREFENLLAELVLGNPGDVLVYAPTRGMNMKAAEVKVHWKGALILLKEIDDPVVKPQLDLILESHKRLWKMRLLCKPTLSRSQRLRVKEAFVTELLVLDVEEQAHRRKALCRDVLGELLLEAGGEVSEMEETRKAVIESAANEAATWLEHDKRERKVGYRDVLLGALRRHLPQSKSKKS